MKLPPAVQAVLDRICASKIPTINNVELRALIALAVRETARECKRIATEIDDNDGFHSGTGERIAALISARYEEKP